jgi:type II secretory pathway pseudopilin PulG
MRNALSTPQNRGLTLVELVSGMVLIGLLAVGSTQVVQHVVQTTRYLPNETNVSQAASELLEAITEGSPTTITGAPQLRLPGLRFAKRLPPNATSILLADANEMWFVTDGSCETVPAPARCVVRIRLDGATGQLMRRYRTVNTGSCATDVFSAEEAIPYFAGGGLQTQGAAGAFPGPLFRYYNSAGAVLATPMPCGNGQLANIRRVEIAARVQTGSGDFDQGEGRLTVTSSVWVRFP